MRDMSQVLERWAGWARSDANNLGYPKIAVGFKNLTNLENPYYVTCSDDDGLMIDACISKLRQKKPVEFDLLFKYYYMNISKRKLAKHYKCDEKNIRIKIMLAEGFIEGCLSMMNLNFDF